MNCLKAAGQLAEKEAEAAEWSEAENEQLLQLYEEQNKQHSVSWKEMADKIGAKTAQQCYMQLQKLCRGGYRAKYEWTSEETDALFKAVEDHTKQGQIKWSKVEKDMKLEYYVVFQRYFQIIDAKKK